MRGREARVRRTERATGKQRAQRASPTMALVWGTERERSRPFECNRLSTSLNLTLAARGETLLVCGGGGRRLAAAPTVTATRGDCDASRRQ